MSRLDYVTIGIVAICVAALVFLIYKTSKLMNTNDPVSDNNSGLVEEPNVYDETSTYEYDDEGEVIPEDSEEDSFGSDRDDDEVIIEDNEIADEEMADEDEPIEEEVTTSSPRAEDASDAPISYSSETGSFMVLAGSFKQKENATAQVDRLHELGYSSAEISMFNRGTFATVLVNRFDEMGEAKSLVRELKNKGVEAYVQKKRGE